MRNDIVTFLIPHKPVPQGRPRVCRFGTYYGKTTKIHMDLVDGVVSDVWRNRAPITGVRLSVRILICGGRINSDLDNHAKMYLDSMKRCGVIEDDDVRHIPLLEVMYQKPVKGEAPFAHVLVHEFVEPEIDSPLPHVHP